MYKIKVYDKVSWHYPEGKNCPNIEAAKKHFILVMKWLNKNDFLTDEGKDIYALGVDSDFSITSDMLTERGNQIFENHYAQWLESNDYKNKSTLIYLDKLLNSYE